MYSLSETIRKSLHKHLMNEIASRTYVPKVRGGWSEAKILRYLKQYPSKTNLTTAIQMIRQFDDIEELRSHLFWHGSPTSQSQLRPSMVLPKNWSETDGGGGYGERYWGISVTSNKYYATNFSGSSGRQVVIHPIVLAKDAVTKSLPDCCDAIDVNEIILDLWDEGVDAVYISGGSEDELLVLNPQCICNISDLSKRLDLKDICRANVPEPTDEELQELLDACKNCKKPQKPIKPSQPDPFMDDENGKYIHKPEDAYQQEMDEYNKKLDDYNEKMNRYNTSDEYKAYQEQMQNLKRLMGKI